MPQAPLKSKPAAKSGKSKIVRYVLPTPRAPPKKKTKKKTRTDSLFYSNAGIMRKGLRSFAPKGKNAAQQNMQRVATASPTHSRGADG
jgi:hypothetical protein